MATAASSLCSNQSSTHANCPVNYDGRRDNESDFITVTGVSLKFSLVPTTATVIKPTINDSDMTVIEGNHNWTDLFSTVGSVAGPSASSAAGAAGGGFGAEVMIPLYSVIFVLSVVGNILVIVTLTQNRRMRTVTNVFLLNLVSTTIKITIR